jgi:hypothetical protein
MVTGSDGQGELSLSLKEKLLMLPSELGFLREGV